VPRIDQLPDDVKLFKQMVLERDAHLQSAQLQIENLDAMLARLGGGFGRGSEALDTQIEQLECRWCRRASSQANVPN
jgi:hypothetical protein